MSRTQHPLQNTLPPNTQTPQTPEWVYDEIMRRIEPDLMLSAAAGRKEKYTGETPEFHRMRMEDYERAFAAFDKAAANVNQQFLAEAKNIRIAQERAAHEEEVSEGARAIADISSQIDHSDNAS